MRNRENVLWLYADPPPGRYQVYAQFYAACGKPAANIEAVVLREGTLVTRAYATLYEFDTREHPRDDEAPGLLLMEFDIP